MGLTVNQWLVWFDSRVRSQYGVFSGETLCFASTGEGFDSPTLHHGSVAQLVERLPEEQGVAGSSPA